MTINAIKEDLKDAKNPIAKSLHQGPGFKVLVIGFNKGMQMQEHKAYHPTKLTIIEGNVIYREGDKNIVLSQYEEVEIPIEVSHSVEALEDSLCLLTQGK